MAGNANSGRRRQTYITDALLIEIKAREALGDKKGLRGMAVAIMDLAETGERWAAEFVRDTVDGKPMQAIEHSGDIGDGTSKDQRDAAFAAAIMAEAEDRKAKLN